MWEIITGLLTKLVDLNHRPSTDELRTLLLSMIEGEITRAKQKIADELARMRDAIVDDLTRQRLEATLVDLSKALEGFDGLFASRGLIPKLDIAVEYGEIDESKKGLCRLCGKPMPEDEQMFLYHGYSGPCPQD